MLQFGLFKPNPEVPSLTCPESSAPDSVHQILEFNIDGRSLRDPGELIQLRRGREPRASGELHVHGTFCVRSSLLLSTRCVNYSQRPLESDWLGNETRSVLPETRTRFLLLFYWLIAALSWMSCQWGRFRCDGGSLIGQHL